MSAAIGSPVSGPSVGAKSTTSAGRFSISSHEFRELLARAIGTLVYERPISRPSTAEDLNGKREESEPRAAPPLQSPGPGPGAAELERESGPAGDSNPSWQPGALDPLALFGTTGLTSAAPPNASPAPGLDPLVGELLRSIAWGGDRRRGTARIELGSGRYRGTTLRVDVVGDGLHIDLEAPAGIDAAELAARLSERFEARGLRVESLLVR